MRVRRFKVAEMDSFDIWRCCNSKTDRGYKEEKPLIVSRLMCRLVVVD